MSTHKLCWGGLLIICWGVLAVGQEPGKVIQHTTVKLTSPASGRAMYTSYCAVCHGVDGKGGGPAADALKTPPADLTVLSQKNGGKFPAAHVATVIGGESNVGAHGTKEMPVWGPVFRQLGHGSTAEYQQRITNLTEYVKSFQAR